MRLIGFVLVLTLLLLIVSGWPDSGSSPTEQQEKALIPVLVSEYNALSDSYSREPSRQQVDSTIVIDVLEWYDSAGLLAPGLSGVLIHQYTDREYSWYNLSLVHDVQLRPGGITFANEGVVVPDMLQDALGPASSSTFLGMPNGTYDLAFVIGDHTDSYKLTVTDSTLELQPVDTLWTRPAHRLLWRARPNTFALYCETEDSVRFVCQEFLDSLLEVIDLREFQIPDSGAAMYERASYGNAKTNPTRYFLYRKNDDFKKATNVLREFSWRRIAKLPGTHVRLHNWNGEHASSWVFINENTNPIRW